MRIDPSISVNLIRLGRLALLSGSALLLFALAGCKPKPPEQPADGRVVEGGRDWKDNREVLSPLILREPLYACADVVWVSGFISGAEVIIFEGANVIGSDVGKFPSGQQFKISPNFVKGQVITARQKYNGVTSGPSNAVTVRSHKDDYPGGIPQPNIIPPPLYKCGIAISANDFIPGAVVTAQSEPPTGGGGFGPATVIGSGSAAAPYPHWWMYINPAYQLGARVSVKYKICGDESALSPPQIVQDQPALPLLKPTVDNNLYEGGTIAVIHDILNGALIKVFSGATKVGESGTPGGGGQQIYISPPAASGAGFTATQALCDTSPPSDVVTVKPCKDLPAAVIKQPQPGDDQVEAIQYVPGATLVILASDGEIGHGGAPVVKLIRELKNGEEITVIQVLGECQSRFVHIITVRCPFGEDPKACAADWPMFRHNTARNAQQPKPSALANPDMVKVLKKKWTFSPSGAMAFRASPIVYKGKVYIGNGNGRFYALDAATGAQIWQYPAANQPALTSQFTCNPSSVGIASSATIARIRDVDAVIFGAPDRSIGKGLGSGRLFALNAQTGAEIWKSPEVAALDGTTGGSTTERHEQIGYSSPLVLNNRVYIGIANHCDNPIQNGKVVAVNLNTGAIDGTFNYASTNTRGGGVWTSVAGGVNGELYITTGNVRSGNPGGEPSVNHSLGLLRLDPATGAVIWKLQPVPFDLDNDPDWASGATYAPSGCGPMAVSTMKDGWTYAVRAGGAAPAAPSVQWQFPPTGFPFTPADGTSHDDTRYLRPGAAWENVFITMTGGENVTADVTDGYARLHGLNICGPRGDRVRWLIDVPGAAGAYSFGPPSVTKGIVFVGTREGRLIVFADQTVWFPAGYRCSNPGVANANCVANGFKLVPQPAILANIKLDNGVIHTEPALAGGRVYVATNAGNLHMLEP